MASCFVYALKQKQQAPFPLQQKPQSVQNAHDWVWLGRQTLDKSSVQSSSSMDVLDNNANSIRSRKSSRTYQVCTQGLPFRFEASADVNIFPIPCNEYGFQHGREWVGHGLYAELPRKRQCPRGRRESQESHQQLYQKSVAASPRLSSRSPFLERRRQLPVTPSSHGSPLPSRRPRPPASSLVNSATYTRQLPVVPSQDILPVGFPIFHTPPGDLEEEQEQGQAFLNPWEALQLETRGELFTQEEEESRQGLRLELAESPPPGYSSLRQSPASALPPYPGELECQPGQLPSPRLIITPEHLAQPRGEYIPLNPDINKRSLPRNGKRKVVSDPFNVTDTEAPPVATDQLSPSHIFSSVEELHLELSRAGEEREEDMSATDLSGQEDNCSSVCSVDSSELEQDKLPNPSLPSEQPSASVSPSTSTNNSLQRRKDLDKDPENLDDVALGSLDYEHLLNYFESLKESSA